MQTSENLNLQYEFINDDEAKNQRQTLNDYDRGARDRIMAGHRVSQHKPLSTVSDKRRVKFSEKMRRSIKG